MYICLRLENESSDIITLNKNLSALYEMEIGEKQKAGENKRRREKTNLSIPEMLKKQTLHLNVTINTK